MKSVDVVVNGKREKIAVPVTIAGFLELSGLRITQVVVEHNGVVQPRQRLNEIDLKEGDSLEVVVPAAGG